MRREIDKNSKLTNFDGRVSSKPVGAPIGYGAEDEVWFDKVLCKHNDLMEAALRDIAT